VAIDIIGMAAVFTGGTQDALAQIDVPQDGVLLGIDWDMAASLNAAETCAVELSFIATNLLNINDVRGRISAVSTHAGLATAVGLSTSFVQKWISGIELFLAAGERLYLHVVSTAGVAGTARCGLWFDGGATVTRRSARRR